MIIEKNLIDIVNQIRDEIVCLYEDKDEDEQLYIEIEDIVENFDIDKDVSIKTIEILKKCLKRKGYFVEIEENIMYIS